MKTRILFSCILLICLPVKSKFQTAISSSSVSDKNFTDRIEYINAQPNHVYITTGERNNNLRTTDLDLTDVVDLIVEFKGKPYLIKKRNGEPAEMSEYSNTFTKFTDKLTALQVGFNKNNRLQTTRYEIKKEYYKLFFGVSIRASRGIINDLAQLSYVKRIHYNRRVKAYINETIKLINADSVWNKYNTKGDSIVVGIIDTGIDYLHPALGGGFGDGHKVIGGYDFINKDDDPMDDNGHGTHVAGIVAANGDSICGVAPNAFLVAVKVLDQYGYGSSETILSGIEYCVDPNDDGLTDDKVDIVNMSLGSDYGSPYSPEALAVDNASSLGITFCISAGNARDFKSIGSPGSAASAITVGATDKYDRIADFSSKGPNLYNYTIKPEVLAPGVDIVSLQSGGGEISHSGTSMSAPHVSGVCALLKSIHREWGPDEMKSALMLTAEDIGEEVMVQGSGRINALKAAEVNTVVSPSLLSFGLDSINYDIWTNYDTVTFSNISGKIQDYSITVNPGIPGVNINFSPDNFSLDPGTSGSVIVDLTVDNSIVPYSEKASLSFGGMVNIQTSSGKLHMPWAFVKPCILKISADTPNINVTITSSRIIEDQYLQDAFYTKEFALPKDEYDIIAFAGFMDTIKVSVTESVLVDGYSELHLKFNELPNSVIYNAVDELGRSLNMLEDCVNDITFRFPEEKQLTSYSMSFNNNTILLSNLSDRFNITSATFHSAVSTEHTVRVIQYPVLNGISQNVMLSNSADEFTGRDVELNFDKETGTVLSAFLILHYINEYSSFGFGLINETIDVSTRKENIKVYLAGTRNNYCNYSSTYLSVDRVRSFNVDYSTVSLFSWEDIIQPYDLNKPGPDVLLSNFAEPIRFGINPIHTRLILYNGVLEDYNFIMFPHIYGSRHESMNGLLMNSTATIFDFKGQTVYSDSLVNLDYMNVDKNYYKVRIENDSYRLRGLEGYFRLESDFDLRKTDSYPPNITSLRLLNGKGESRDHFKKGENANLYFSTADFNLIGENNNFFREYNSVDTSKTELLISVDDSEKWKPVPLEIILEDSTIGYLYKSDISSYAAVDSGSVNLKIIIGDLNSNMAEWTLAPAFTVGKEPVITGLDHENSSTNELSYKLDLNYPNPFNPSTRIKFEIPEAQKVRLIIYDILGREVKTIANDFLEPGSYEFSWKGRNNNGHEMSSGVYFYNITTENFTQTKKMILLR